MSPVHTRLVGLRKELGQNDRVPQGWINDLPETLARG